MDQKSYDDIINLPHHISKKHPQMSLEKRAAQFAPFAALTGFEDVINDTRVEWENAVENEIFREEFDE